MRDNDNQRVTVTINGFVYRKEKSTDKYVYWRCSANRKFSCKARARSLAGPNEMKLLKTTTTPEHTHTAEEAKQYRNQANGGKKASKKSAKRKSNNNDDENILYL